MKVQRLVMNSFGNQQDKIVDFSDGVNLIMGTDISTLDTVRSFIDGMLFGLTPENKKRYRPYSGSFSGSIYLEDESGLQFRVDRDFESGQYSITTSNGDDITADFSDEYGNLALLPTSDSIFARETIEFPKEPEKSLKRLSELKAKRELHIKKHDYEGLLKEREALLKDINEQRKIEDRLEKNTEEISQREIRIAALNSSDNLEFIQLDQDIATFEEENEKISAQIKELKVKESLKRGDKENVLKRSIQSADDQLDLIERRIIELDEEKDVYEDKLKKFEEAFTIDRAELKQDYEIYRDELKRERGESREPFVDKLISHKNWVYTLLIILGMAGIALALYNPVDILGRVVIFLVCFVSVFMILMSALALYLRTSKNQTLALVEGIPDEDQEGSSINAIVRKYHQDSPEAFNDFYSNANRIFQKIDSLKSDLTNIRREIGQAETERAKIINDKKEAAQSLAAQEKIVDTSVDEEIEKLKRQQKANQARIDELKEERELASSNSIWKLKEESMRLEETNKKLKRLVSGNEEIVERFNKLQRRIDRYESKLNGYDREIKEIEDSLQAQKEDFYLSYAEPENTDYDLKMAKQFGFGLQNNLDQGMDVPYISLDPFTIAGTEDERLVEKLKDYIEDKQVLIFSSSMEEEIILSKHKIKHNGIFIANRRAERKVS